MVHTVSVLRRAPALALAALAAVTLAAACSASDGRALPPPDPRSTTTAVSAPVVGQPSGSDADVFSLGSPAFVDGGPIPEEYTCTGDATSPPLSWASTPPAAELALVVRDLDAGGFVHWVVTGIDPVVQGFGQGGVPESAVEAMNGGGTVGWFPPCPPAGSGSHTYELSLHALPEPLALAPGHPGAEAAQLVEGASAAVARLTGRFPFSPAG